jgi:mono/diheme cytochrome c family protein
MRQVSAVLKAAAGVGVLMAGMTVAQAQPAGDMAALMSVGEPIFTRVCSACHGAAGGGGEGPALAGNERIASISLIMDQVIRGGAYMPPFGALYNDEQVAGVATYIRNSWGNSFGAVTAEQVANYR